MSKEAQKKYSQIIAKAWSDESFKDRLITDPHEVLKEHGIAAPAGTQIKVIQDTDDTKHFILPSKPAGTQEGLTTSIYCGLDAIYCGYEITGSGEENK